MRNSHARVLAPRDPTEFAYYRAFEAVTTRIKALVRVADMRWAIEVGF